LVPGEDWQLVSEGYKFTEGAAVNSKGEIFFNDIPNSKTFKISLDGKVAEFIADSKKANGQHFGPDGKLYVVATAELKILAYDTSGNVSIVAEGISGNDLVVAHNGNIYVTEPRAKGAEPSVLWLIRPDGKKQIADKGLQFANGVTLSPDQSLLYVADSRSHWIYSYQIQPDGTLKNKQRYYWLHVPDSAEYSSADGMRVDRDGQLYVATRMGIQICDQAGRVNAILPTPNGRSSNLCFGGEKFDTLYVTAGDKVFKRKLKTQGAHGWDVPNKPAAPRL
jgi:gluconolactonase